jgi:hypothetical protein
MQLNKQLFQLFTGPPDNEIPVIVADTRESIPLLLPQKASLVDGNRQGGCVWTWSSHDSIGTYDPLSVLSMLELAFFNIV